MSQTMLPGSIHAIPKTQTERDAAKKHAAQLLPLGSGVMNLQDVPDEPGSEMAKDSRVWKTYVKETDRWDREFVEGRNNSLDVLLIFAALFSAVSTAFVIESMSDLKPDRAESSSDSLLIISQTLVAMSNGQAVAPSVLDTTAHTPFVASHTAVIVNLLWFLSLSLSIAVSLIAMLAKEWCYKFMSGRSGPMYEQARRRQQRWNGIEKWKMKEVLTYLQGMMHLALLLFATGLSIYLWDINIRVAVPVVVVTASATLLYVCTTILPLLDDHCPYATPVTSLILDVTRIRVAAYSFFHWLYTRTDGSKWFKSPLRYVTNVLETRKHASKEPVTERDVPMDVVTSQMLSWMIFNCEDSRSVDFALQGLIGSTAELPYRPLIKAGLVQVASARIQAHMEQWMRIPETSRSSDPSMLALTANYSRLYSLLVTQRVCSDPRDRWDGYLSNEQFYRLTYNGIDMIEVNAFILKHVESVSRDLNEVAIAVSATTPFCHFGKGILPRHESMLGEIKSLAPRLLTSTLTKHMDSPIPLLSIDVLQALVQSSVHYLIGLHPREELANCRMLLPVLLARLFITLDVASTRLRQTIAVTLAVAAFATDIYPGGDEPSHDDDSREKRAMKVLHHYRVTPPNDHHTLTLLRFGFIGLLRRIEFVSLEQHTDLVRKILEITSTQEGIPQVHACILPAPFDPREHAMEATLKCLALVPQSQLTLEAEGHMASHCLIHLILSDSERSISADPRLYIPVLVALCHAQSDELQDLCIAVLRGQGVPTYPRDIIADLKKHNLFDLLHSCSASSNQRIAPTAALHFTLLVAVIIVFPKHPFDTRRAVFESLIQCEEFSNFIHSRQDLRQPNPEDLCAAIENTPDPNFASGISTRVKQLVVDFYFATPNHDSAWAVHTSNWSIFKLPQMLKKMKAKFESGSKGVGPLPVVNVGIAESARWPQKNTVQGNYA